MFSFLDHGVVHCNQLQMIMLRILSLEATCLQLLVVCLCFRLSFVRGNGWVNAGQGHGVILDMSTRLNIAIDVAQALAYLHYYTGNWSLTWVIWSRTLSFQCWQVPAGIGGGGTLAQFWGCKNLDNFVLNYKMGCEKSVRALAVVNTCSWLPLFGICRQTYNT